MELTTLIELTGITEATWWNCPARTGTARPA
ncbi:MAG: hypothetical protein QOH05_3963 [Acetobacteraceae bacterium]|jgi:hypothetical protein|nr:hypothetical protein [Acetobacteraceae bacterium]